MNILYAVIEIIRTISFYLVCCIAMVLCYNLIGFIFSLDYPGKSRKALMYSFSLLILVLILDNTIYSIYHIHIFNTKIALGAVPDPLF